MLTMNNYARRYRATTTYPTLDNNAVPLTNPILARPRLTLRAYMKPKSSGNLANIENSPFSRSKRFKSRKINGCQKTEIVKKKTPDYTENAYREAVSKLKYLLAESYAPRLTTGKISRERGFYRRSNLRISESPEESDERSVSECSRAKYLGNRFENGSAEDATRPKDKSRRLADVSRNSVVYPAHDVQSSPSELTSFIARQEEYIEQLEQESRYCKDELKNLLGKIREVVAENEALHDKNKAGLLKSFLHEYENWDENKKPEDENQSNPVDSSACTGTKISRRLEGPSIVFESRISELEAQLTQARIELKKAREENDACSRRLAEASGVQASPDCIAQLECALREKQELAARFEEATKSVQAARERENEASQRAKRAAEHAQQTELEKYQTDTEIRRLNDELDRLREKLREAAQETSKRVSEERHQIERRYSQQVEQLSADVASHWDAASKSQMETERQRRELSDLKRDLAQKQSMIDELKKELQNKISNLQSELNRTIAEKDAADQEVASAKLAAERGERQARQEQIRWQAETNSYKQRLERADADIVHCRRENLRLSEQIASLEKELSMSKLVQSPETQGAAAAASSSTPRPEGEKDLATMIMDIETKHAATVAGLEDVLSNQAKLVARLTDECQSLTHRLEANDRTHKEEMAGLQSNLDHLSSKIADTLENQKAGLDKKEKSRIEELSVPASAQIPKAHEYREATDYSANGRSENETTKYPVIPRENADVDSRVSHALEPANYTTDERYETQEYPDDRNYADEYIDRDYDQYEQYDPSLYEGNQTHEQITDQQQNSSPVVAYQPPGGRYEDYPDESYIDGQQECVASPSTDDRQEHERTEAPNDANVPEC